MVDKGVTNRQIAIQFENIYPNVREITERSMRRYCKWFDITRLSQVSVNLMISDLTSLYMD